MAAKDWKDQLSGLLGPDLQYSSEQKPAKKPVEFPDNKPVSRQELILRFEKRNGKPTTIISNVQCTPKELEELASQLKKHCSAGGSAKDDEILIQGDVRTKVANYLEKMGHKVRGDFKR